MRKLVFTMLVAIPSLLGVTPVIADVDERAAVRKVLNTYIDAALAKDGKKLLTTFSKPSIQYYSYLVEDAKYADQATLMKRPRLRLMGALVARLSVPTAQLKTMGGKGLVEHFVTAGALSVNRKLMDASLITVNKTGTIALIQYPGKKQMPIPFFSKETGKWLVDIMPANRRADENAGVVTVKQVEQAMKQISNRLPNKPNVEKLWEPPFKRHDK